MDKKELITKIIFGSEDLSKVSFPANEDVKENFEIAWDVWENFEEIKRDLLSKFIRELKDKVEKELSIKEHGFIVTCFDWGSLYVSKPEWLQKNGDRGIYSIAVEKWNRDYFTIGIARNNTFRTDKESEIINILQSLNYRTTQWFIGYIPLDSYFYSSNKEFYLNRLLGDYDNLLEKTFIYLKKVYEDLIGNSELLNLFEESVKQRKNN